VHVRCQLSMKKSKQQNRTQDGEREAHVVGRL
jgi:hypothetical protein